MVSVIVMVERNGWLTEGFTGNTFDSIVNDMRSVTAFG